MIPLLFPNFGQANYHVSCDYLILFYRKKIYVSDADFFLFRICTYYVLMYILVAAAWIFTSAGTTYIHMHVGQTLPSGLKFLVEKKPTPLVCVHHSLTVFKIHKASLSLLPYQF